jgi:hypothetical protein
MEGVEPVRGLETELDPGTVVGLLAEPVRLRVVAALALGAETLGEVVAAAGVSVRGASRALDRLVAGGLVDVVPATRGQVSQYRLCEERLTTTAKALARPPRAAEPDGGASQPDVLRNFVAGGRLVAIPAVRSKRLVVLDWLSGRFEPGKVYPEREVNYILGVVHDDYAALRRYLVDESFLERRDGFYWRAGGTFDVD